MATAQTRKTSTGTKSGAKTAPKNSDRSTARRPASRSRGTDVPGWAATIASVVGVGVAVGVGLYATRRQWLPKAEQWGEELNDRFDGLKEKYGSHASNDHEDDMEADEWNDDLGISDATYPVSRPAA